MSKKKGSETTIEINRPISAIVLLGPMGAGKSTVAKALARMIGWRCVDVDECIEAKAGAGISEIFEKDGEAAFRKIESECLAELAENENVVIAPGGGSVLTEANRKLLNSNEKLFCVHLDAATATLIARLDKPGREKRPLLEGEGWRQSLESIVAERGPLWAACADLSISTDGKDPGAVAAMLMGRLIPAIVAASAPG